ncbi:hypothetical protein D3C76_1430300 [compost metagenome]
MPADGVPTRAPRGARLPALSLTTIVGTPPGACSLLQGVLEQVLGDQLGDLDHRGLAGELEFYFAQ